LVSEQGNLSERHPARAKPSTTPVARKTMASNKGA
jgi:hypothetical protein